MKRLLFLSAILALLSLPARAVTNDARQTPESLPEFKPLPEMVIMPANITLYNQTISLLPAGQSMFVNNGYAPGARTFIPDLAAWQRNYIRDNNLRSIPHNPTLADGRVMGYAVDHPSMANQELYHTYVLMNRRWVGDTQLERMNGGARGIRYVDFIGAGQMAAKYLIDYVNDPRMVERGDYPFRKLR